MAADRPIFSLRMGDQEHPIRFAGTFTPNREYTIQELKFTDEFGQIADGCLFEIQPRKSTRIMRIIEAGVKCEEMAVGETGFFVGIDPDGQVFAFPVGVGQKENPLIAQRTGSVGVWIAGEKGLTVVNITQPPFDPKYEKEVGDTDPKVPFKFWEIYDKLRDGNPWEEVQKLL